MQKESVWDSSVIKALSALAAILGIITFFLTFGKDLWTPLSNFLPSQYSIYALSITIAVIIFLLYQLIRVKKLGKTKVVGKNILDLPFARTITIACRIPKATGYLRQLYENWINVDNKIAVLTFNDYMERLEKQEYLIFKKRDQTWQATKKALDYIFKYHGGD